MIIIPSALQIETLTTLLTPALSLRLYGNNVVPDVTKVTADFTEVAGGGYALKALTLANWIIISGSNATYNASQVFTFTGALNAPGTIYGYLITRNSDGKLILAERFPTVPFSPVNGSQVALTPFISLINQ